MTWLIRKQHLDFSHELFRREMSLLYCEKHVRALSSPILLQAMPINA